MSDFTRKAVMPPSVPSMPFYSLGIETSGATRTLHIAGQIGMRIDGTVGNGIAEQTQIAVANVEAVLAAAGMTKANIVKNTIYMTDPSQIEEMTKAAAGSLSSPPPATTLIIVKALAAPNLLIEIEAIAVA